MILAGGTLLSEPCPYCKGVRVMKDGNALCINCGKEPETNQTIVKPNTETKTDFNPLLLKLEKKLEQMTNELSEESNHEKQESLLHTMNLLVEMIKKMKE